MTKKEKGSVEPLERDLLNSLRAIDNQISREMQRNPAELAQHGVQKWEPFSKRIEKICALLLTAFGEDRCKLDSVLVMSQALTKALRIIVEDLEEDGLGNVRAAYCRAAMDAIERDARDVLQMLGARHGAGDMM